MTVSREVRHRVRASIALHALQESLGVLYDLSDDPLERQDIWEAIERHGDSWKLLGAEPWRPPVRREGTCPSPASPG